MIAIFNFSQAVTAIYEPDNLFYPAEENNISAAYWSPTVLANLSTTRQISYIRNINHRDELVKDYFGALGGYSDDLSLGYSMGYLAKSYWDEFELAEAFVRAEEYSFSVADEALIDNLYLGVNFKYLVKHLEASPADSELLGLESNNFTAEITGDLGLLYRLNENSALGLNIYNFREVNLKPGDEVSYEYPREIEINGFHAPVDFLEFGFILHELAQSNQLYHSVGGRFNYQDRFKLGAGIYQRKEFLAAEVNFKDFGLRYRVLNFAEFENHQLGVKYNF